MRCVIPEKPQWTPSQHKCGEALADTTLTDLVDQLKAEVADLRQEMANLDDGTGQLLALELECATLKKQQYDEDNKGATRIENANLFVKNPVTNKCHRVLIQSGLPLFWKTKCG